MIYQRKLSFMLLFDCLAGSIPCGISMLGMLEGEDNVFFSVCALISAVWLWRGLRLLVHIPKTIELKENWMADPEINITYESILLTKSEAFTRLSICTIAFETSVVKVFAEAYPELVKDLQQPEEIH